MVTLTVEHLYKQFEMDAEGHRVARALQDVSFKMLSGEVLALLGPSGCGKSTLLRLIAGLMRPDHGRVLYDGVDIQQIPHRERGIGMVFQEFALVPHWESERTIGFFLRLRKREREIPQRIRSISAITGISLQQLLARKPAQLSGGEKQRVAIARALARDLRILLLDEPFANLDAKFRTESRLELKRLLRQFPVTTLYVTHDQTEATALADRIAIMREGRLEQIGTYEHLYASPTNLFVAEFIGTPKMNLFQGVARGGIWFGENFGGLPIRKDLPDDTAVTAGIRPEHIILQKDGTPAVVQQIQAYYAERYQLLEVWLGREHWSLAVPLDVRVQRGETVYCALKGDEVLFFDTRTGKRIG